jgi:hypothetical protein
MKWLLSFALFIALVLFSLQFKDLVSTSTTDISSDQQKKTKIINFNNEHPNALSIVKKSEKKIFPNSSENKANTIPKKIFEPNYDEIEEKNREFVNSQKKYRAEQHYRISRAKITEKRQQHLKKQKQQQNAISNRIKRPKPRVVAEKNRAEIGTRQREHLQQQLQMKTHFKSHHKE